MIVHVASFQRVSVAKLTKSIIFILFLVEWARQPIARNQSIRGRNKKKRRKRNMVKQSTEVSKEASIIERTYSLGRMGSLYTPVQYQWFGYARISIYTNGVLQWRKRDNLMYYVLLTFLATDLIMKVGADYVNIISLCY